MREARAARAIEILLVEDSPGDARLTREALRDGKIANRLSVVTDGVAALAFVRQEAPYEEAPRPDLILLDLNLPKKDGREVLAELKADAQMREIPVVVLTASGDEQDVLRATTLEATAYITKPVDLTQFLLVVRAIDAFRFSIVMLLREATGVSGVALMRVLLADDHALFRNGLRGLLEARGVEVVGEARNGHEDGG